MEDEQTYLGWRPIKTAREWFHAQGLAALVEKSGGTQTWATVLVWCPKSRDRDAGVYFAKLIDWGPDDKNTHWRTVDGHDDTLTPTHWMPIPVAPGK